MGTFHLVNISGISGWAVNGTRFVGSSHWKIPRKSGKSKKVGPFSWLEFPNGILCSIYTFLVVCTSSRSTVRHRDLPGFTTKWNNFLPIRNSTFAPTEISVFFFLNGKHPTFEHVAQLDMQKQNWEWQRELQWWVEFFSREGSRYCYILTNDNNKKDQK